MPAQRRLFRGKNIGLVDLVEKRIGRYIRTHKLRLGKVLPKEQDFADQFGVTRNVVREALSRLRMLGVVESRKRRGMVLVNPDMFAGPERLVEIGIVDQNSERDIFETRLVLELGLADFIFARKTAEDIRVLRDIVRKEQLSRGNPALEDKLEVAFHSRLFKVAGNQLIARFHNVMSSFFAILRKRNLDFVPGKQASSHAELVNALEKGTARDFCDLMRLHLIVYILPACPPATAAIVFSTPQRE